MHMIRWLARLPFNAVRLLAYAGALSAAAWAPGAFAEHQHHKVVIESMQFTPRTLEIKRGDTVEWVNKDLFSHNATAGDRSFASPEIAPGESWQWKAETSGTTSYLCTLHPTMKAVLVVR
jgi:plastocyanin